MKEWAGEVSFCAPDGVNDWPAERVLTAVRKKVYLLLGILAASVVGGQWLGPSRPESPDGSPATVARPEGQKVGAASVPSLPPREQLARQAGQPFRPLSWEPPARNAVAGHATEPLRPVAPYRVAGTVTYDAEPEIVLVKGNRVVIVRQGDTLEDGYRVDTVAADHVSLLYVPSGTVEHLPLATGAEILAGLQSGPSAAAGGTSATTRPSLPPVPLLPALPR
jgi:hypothetical protein